MIEVFKTNVLGKDEADKVVALLKTNWQHLKVNVDLNDCDKVLRVESTGETIDIGRMISFLAWHDFEVELLH